MNECGFKTRNLNLSRVQGPKGGWWVKNWCCSVMHRNDSLTGRERRTNELTDLQLRYLKLEQHLATVEDENRRLGFRAEAADQLSVKLDAAQRDRALLAEQLSELVVKSEFGRIQTPAFQPRVVRITAPQLQSERLGARIPPAIERALEDRATLFEQQGLLREQEKVEMRSSARAVTEGYRVLQVEKEPYP